MGISNIHVLVRFLSNSESCEAIKQRYQKHKWRVAAFGGKLIWDTQLQIGLKLKNTLIRADLMALIKLCYTSIEAQCNRDNHQVFKVEMVFFTSFIFCWLCLIAQQ